MGVERPRAGSASIKQCVVAQPQPAAPTNGQDGSVVVDVERKVAGILRRKGAPLHTAEWAGKRPQPAAAADQTSRPPAGSRPLAPACKAAFDAWQSVCGCMARARAGVLRSVRL